MPKTGGDVTRKSLTALIMDGESSELLYHCPEGVKYRWSNKVRKGNRKGERARKWKTSLFCLLRVDCTQCKEDRAAERRNSDSPRSSFSDVFKSPASSPQDYRCQQNCTSN